MVVDSPWRLGGARTYTPPLAPGWVIRVNAALILTAALDDKAFAHFDDLRQRYYPKERNVVPAHVTLFHALPTNHEPRIRDILIHFCDTTPVLPGKATRPRKLNEGVAFELEAEELALLQFKLKEAFGGWCTAQDRLPYKPQVTIANHLPPAEARLLFETMQLRHSPFEVSFMGIEMWRYTGGPWQPIERIDFVPPLPG